MLPNIDKRPFDGHKYEVWITAEPETRFFVNVVRLKSGFAANCTAVCQDALMEVLTGFEPQLRCRDQSRAQLKVL